MAFLKVRRVKHLEIRFVKLNPLIDINDNFIQIELSQLFAQHLELPLLKLDFVLSFSVINFDKFLRFYYCRKHADDVRELYIIESNEPPDLDRFK